MLAKFKNHDWIITIIISILAVFSLLLIFSTTYNASNPQEGEGTVSRQVIFYIIGFVIYFLMSSLDLSWLKQRNIVLGLYFLIFFSLVYLLFFGEVRANTQRWIFLGPFSFQPAEYAKITITILTAYIFAQDDEKIGIEKKDGMLPATYWKLFIAGSALAFYLILIYLQPSLGNALILLIIWTTTVFITIPIDSKTWITLFIGFLAAASYFQLSIFDGIANASFLNDLQWKIFTISSLIAMFIALYMLFKFNKYILIAVTSVIIIVAPMFDLSWNYVLRDYHKKRIETYLSGFNADPTDSGYQVRQSIIAVGAGQLNGRGYLKGTQSTLKNLPFAHTDFIFAALAEQFGFLGVTALFGIYSILIGRLFILASKITDQFSKILVTGVISLITINIFVNTAMNLGLIPVTGVPLPLISHGGSSVLVIMISLGLIQMVNNSVNSKDLTEKFVWRI